MPDLGVINLTCPSFIRFAITILKGDVCLAQTAGTGILLIRE